MALQKPNPWVKKVEINQGCWPNVMTGMAEAMRALERENHELRQPNGSQRIGAWPRDSSAHFA
jgi:hypothetical protein